MKIPRTVTYLDRNNKVRRISYLRLRPTTFKQLWEIWKWGININIEHGPNAEWESFGGFSDHYRPEVKLKRLK